MTLDALFFAAHPDDAELCCGGTIAKLTKNGKKTAIIDLTRGELGTRGSVELREKEAKAAGKMLGISARENLGIQDGNIENTEENRLKVISLSAVGTGKLFLSNACTVTIAISSASAASAVHSESIKPGRAPVLPRLCEGGSGANPHSRRIIAGRSGKRSVGSFR